MDYWIISILQFALITHVYGQQFFNTMPPPVNTNFTCRGRDTGFYADIETNCRVYHTCDENGNKFTYYCPAETAFRQEALVCDHAHLVDCKNGRRISRIDKIIENKNEDAKRPAKNPERYSSSFSSKIFSSNQDVRAAEKTNDPSQSESSNSAYARSFKIIQEPRSRYSTSESSNSRKPTFVLSSSVFLRDRETLKKRQPIVEQNNSASRMNNLNNLKNFSNSEAPPEVSDAPNKKKDSKHSRLFSPTTMLPKFVEEFRDYHRDTMIFPSSNFDKLEKSTRSHSVKFSSATPRIPSGQNYRYREQNIEDHRYDKSKSNYENGKGNAESFAVRADNNDREKISFSDNASREFEDEKRSREKKIESRYDFQGYSTSSEVTMEPDARGRNREEIDDFFGNTSKNTTFYKNWERSDKNAKDEQISVYQRPPFFYDNSNFPYSETLRSMQAMTEATSKSNSTIDESKRTIHSSTTTFSPPTTAGTEFPVHPLVGTFLTLGPNESDDDPYYPKRPTTTEIYYRLGKPSGEERKTSRFSTKRPWLDSLNFEIPEVLPDLNTLDDLVDRRKIFYIPRIKAA